MKSLFGRFLFSVIFVFLLLLLILLNPIDLITATSALIACMANIGPGLGDVHETFATLSDRHKEPDFI